MMMLQRRGRRRQAEPHRPIDRIAQEWLRWRRPVVGLARRSEARRRRARREDPGQSSAEWAPTHLLGWRTFLGSVGQGSELHSPVWYLHGVRSILFADQDPTTARLQTLSCWWSRSRALASRPLAGGDPRCWPDTSAFVRNTWSNGCDGSTGQAAGSGAGFFTAVYFRCARTVSSRLARVPA